VTGERGGFPVQKVPKAGWTFTKGGGEGTKFQVRGKEESRRHKPNWVKVVEESSYHEGGRKGEEKVKGI